jgi:short-subunit dehydrogenase
MKVTLITGASGGIGEAFARNLARKRQNLVLVARSENRLHEICDELMLQYGITAHYVAVDLNDFEADQRLFDETEKHGMEVDWLINNAGFGSMGEFTELSLERELEMIGLNVMVLVALTHRYLKGMRARKRGTIINVSSAAGFQPIPYMATYAATKAFVTSFSEAIAEENRQFGITVTALCPGPTDTGFFETAKAIPFSAMQTADEVVETGLRAVERKKSLVISGWTNYLKAHAATFVPNSLVTKFISGVMRPKLKAQKRLKN